MAVSVLNMKKAVALLLAAVCILCAGCTVASPAYMSSGKYGITVSMYKYWLAYYKTRFYSSFVSYGIFDGEYDESVWEQSPDGDKTFSEQVTEYVDGLIKQMIICAKLYDEMGLSSDKETKQLLESTVDQFVNDDIAAVGSRPELNSLLGKIGMNINTLRRVFEYEAKAMIVADRLFGEGGKYAVTDEEREEYYQQNYHRVKHILINNSFKYVTDENGEPVMNTGRYEREDLTDEEKAEKLALAQQLFERVQNGGNFEELIETYNEDDGMSTYTEGYFITPDTMLDTKYITAAITLKDGEASLEETSYGLMIIKKYPLIAGIWSDETYSGFFSDMDADIIEIKKNEIYGARFGEITVNDAEKTAFAGVPLLDTRLLSSFAEEE